MMSRKNRTKRQKYRPIALIATHGTPEAVSYITVAIQDKPRRQGGKLLDSRVFYSRDFAGPRELASAALNYCWSRRVKTTYGTSECLPEECRNGCSEPTIRMLD